jgi:hypothetical protein
MGRRQPESIGQRAASIITAPVRPRSVHGDELWLTELGDIKIGETITMAPLVVHGKVLVGNSGGEYGVRGRITALDASDDSLVWRAYSTGPDREALIGERFKLFYPQDRGKDLGVAMPGGLAAAPRLGLGHFDIQEDASFRCRSMSPPALGFAASLWTAFVGAGNILLLTVPHEDVDPATARGHCAT